MNTIRKQVLYDGKTYSSYKNLTSELGISYQSFHLRLREGASVEDAVEGARQARKRNIPVTYGGIKYDSYAHLARELSLPYDNLVAQIRNGLSVDEAVDHLKSKSTITFEGVEYSSLRKLADSHSIHSATLHNRMKRGMSLEKAVAAGRRKKLIVNGKSYRSVKEVCKDYNVSTATVYRRMQKGLSLKEAVEAETPSGYRYEYRGQQYSLAELADIADLKYNTVYERLRHGWTVEEAVETPVGELPQAGHAFEQNL